MSEDPGNERVVAGRYRLFGKSGHGGSDPEWKTAGSAQGGDSSLTAHHTELSYLPEQTVIGAASQRRRGWRTSPAAARVRSR